GEVWRRRAFKGHARRIQGQGGAGVLRPSRGHHLAVVEGERGPAEADDAGRGCGQGPLRPRHNEAAARGKGRGPPRGRVLPAEDVPGVSSAVNRLTRRAVAGGTVPPVPLNWAMKALA